MTDADADADAIIMDLKQMRVQIEARIRDAWLGGCLVGALVGALTVLLIQRVA